MMSMVMEAISSWGLLVQTLSLSWHRCLGRQCALKQADPLTRWQNQPEWAVAGQRRMLPLLACLCVTLPPIKS